MRVTCFCSKPSPQKQLAMQPAFNITVAEPCQEDWNKMSPVEQGRFCGSCQKNVIDFTSKSDEEIIAFFNNYNGSSCGRFADEQLNRPIQSIELKPASRFIKYAASLLMPAAVFSVKASAQTKSPASNDTIEAVQFDPSTLVTVGTFMTAPAVKGQLVEGKVIDAVTKEPMSGVSVTVKGTGIGVVTADDGSFKVTVTSHKDVLQYSYIGYETAAIKLSKSSVKNAVVLKMKQTPMLMGEVIVVGYATRKGKVACTTSVKKTTNTFWNRIKDTLLPAPVQIYPNPVAASGTVQLTFPDVKPGAYQIRVLNNNGQLFYSFQKQISGKNETEQIHLSKLMAAGIYVVQVTDEKNKMIQNSKLIIQ